LDEYCVAKAGKMMTVTEHHGAWILSRIFVPGNHNPQSVCRTLATKHSDLRISQDFTPFLMGRRKAVLGHGTWKAGHVGALLFSVLPYMNAISYHELGYSLTSKLYGK
jgi:hypothetical protein